MALPAPSETMTGVIWSPAAVDTARPLTGQAGSTAPLASTGEHLAPGGGAQGAAVGGQGGVHCAARRHTLGVDVRGPPTRTVRPRDDATACAVRDDDRLISRPRGGAHGPAVGGPGRVHC